MPAIGLGVRIGNARRVRPFSPFSLFAASEPGVWLDPSAPAMPGRDALAAMGLDGVDGATGGDS